MGIQQKFKRLGKETIIYGIGGMATKFIAFLMLPIYTRVFQPSDYGAMDVIANLTALAGIILTAGIETALSFYFFHDSEPEQRRSSITTAATYLFGINLSVALIVWLFAPQISHLIFGSAEYARYLRIGILTIPFSSLVSLNLNILRLQRKPWRYIGLSLPQMFFDLTLDIILVVILHMGIVGVFWSNLMSSILFATIGLVVNRQYFGLSFKVKRLVQLLRYGLPLVISGVSVWAINYLDRYFLLHYSNLEQVGLYSVGIRFASLVAFVTQAFRTANAPFQFEISHEGDAPLIYSRTMTYYLLLSSLLCVPLALFARPILVVMTTASYLDASAIIGLACYSAVAYGAYQLVSVGLLVSKKTLYTGVAIGLGALFNFLYLYLLVQPFGIVGAAASVLMTHLTVVTLLYLGAQKYYPIPFELKKIFLLLGLVTLVLGIHTMIPLVNFWMDLVISMSFFLLFLAAIPLLSILTPSEISGLRITLTQITTLVRWNHPAK